VGNELWVTDGTANGTQLVADLLAGPQSSEPQEFAVAGNHLLFVTKISANQFQLQSLDLATDTVTPLNNTFSSLFGSTPVKLITLDDAVWFIAAAAGDIEIWRSDGTVGGTLPIVDENPAATASGALLDVVSVADHLLYAAPNQGGSAVWSMDTVGGQTRPLVDLTDLSYLGAAAVIGNRAYLKLESTNSTGTALFQTDGTPAGSLLLSQLGKASHSDVAAAGTAGAVYFVVGGKVWGHDPTTGQSTLLLGGGASATPIRMLGNRLLFAHNGSFTGREPWITDGTSAGTHIVVDTTPAARTLGSDPSELTDVNGTLFFLANDGIVGRHIWRSDGTAAGTARVTQFSSSESAMSGLFSAGGSLYFRTTPVSPSGLAAFWRVPAAGGEPIKLADTSLMARAALNNVVFMTAGFPAALWRSDGTAAGTQPVFAPGTGPQDIGALFVHGGRLYFTARNPNNTFSVWVSDGTAAGSCKSFDAGEGFATDTATLYFLRGGQVWRTNGSCGNSEVVVAAGANESLRATGRGVFFGTQIQLTPGNQMFPPTFAKLLWFNALDGTPNIRVGDQMNTNSPWETLGSDLLFVQTSNVSVLWASDGTTAGTRLLRDLQEPMATIDGFRNFNGRRAFFTEGFEGNFRTRTVWTTDATATGTRSHAKLFVGPGPGPQLSREMLASGHRLFFTHRDPIAGFELFALENEAPIAGTDSGTVEAGRTLQLSVVGNDQDLDGSIARSTVRIVRQPSLGSASVTTDGVVSYSPRSNESGGDSLEYVVADDQGRESNRARVNLTVTASTAPPSGGGGGGGGGAVSLIELLAAAAIYIWSRLLTAPCRTAPVRFGHERSQGVGSAVVHRRRSRPMAVRLLRPGRVRPQGSR
jgi:ELWxxDGT repeat protein